jgi:hypothetical protein
MQQLAGMFRVGTEPTFMPPHSPKYPEPHCVYRSKMAYAAQGAKGIMRDLWKAMPELATFVDEELDALSSEIAGQCRNKKAAARIVEHVRKAMLIAIDTTRLDT